MYKGVISKYVFELEVETNRITVHCEGEGVDPVAFISVEPNLSEKAFHYEIMSWVADNSKNS
jgi:hypothetical protein